MITLGVPGVQMRCSFEIFRRALNAAESDHLLHVITEECHPEEIAHRAKALLWTLPLDLVQDLVVVKDAATGRKIMQRAVGSGRHRRL